MFFKKCRTTGLFFIIFALAVLLTFALPSCVLVVIEGILLLCAGWMLFR